jgi:hypothetical protein
MKRSLRNLSDNLLVTEFLIRAFTQICSNCTTVKKIVPEPLQGRKLTQNANDVFALLIRDSCGCLFSDDLPAVFGTYVAKMTGSLGLTTGNDGDKGFKNWDR